VAVVSNAKHRDGTRHATSLSTSTLVTSTGDRGVALSVASWYSRRPQIPCFEGFMKVHAFNPKYPFSPEEFSSPQLAVQRYGLSEALLIYREFVEPQYTNDGLPGLPKDWEWRKFFVYHRANERCQRSGCGRKPEFWTAHHIVHRGEGGNHALSNLKLLCDWPCHKLEHPEKRKPRVVDDVPF